MKNLLHLSFLISVLHGTVYIFIWTPKFLELWEDLGWKELHSPNSCFEAGQLGNSIRLLRALPSWALRTSKYGVSPHFWTFCSSPGTTVISNFSSCPMGISHFASCSSCLLSFHCISVGTSTVWEVLILWISTEGIVLHDWLGVLGSFCLFSCQIMAGAKIGYWPS